MNVYPWDLITKQEFKFLLVRQRRYPSHSKYSACPHVCQWFLCCPTLISFILEDLTGPLLNFYTLFTLAQSHKQGTDHTYNNQHVHLHKSTQASQDRMENVYPDDGPH